MSAEEPGEGTGPAYRAVLFDLLTALLDSGALWAAVAGDADAARRWRRRYLDLTYSAGRYQPYEALVARAAAEAGLDPGAGEQLVARYAELRPWPGVAETLGALRGAGVALGVVTNCSESVGRVAAEAVGVPFDTVVTAEAAGVYKPEPGVYEAGLAALGAPRSATLFVAGSPYDLVGTALVGLDTFWHDRAGMALPAGVAPPLARAPHIEPVLGLVGLAGGRSA